MVCNTVLYCIIPHYTILYCMKYTMVYTIIVYYCGLSPPPFYPSPFSLSLSLPSSPDGIHDMNGGKLNHTTAGIFATYPIGYLSVGNGFFGQVRGRGQVVLSHTPMVYMYTIIVSYAGNN